MTLLVLCISLIVLGFGAVGILAPLRLIKFVLWFDNPRGLYAAAAFRIIFGLFLRFCWVGFWFMLFGGRLVFSGAARRKMAMVIIKNINIDNNI
jgi:hypothetical protein